MHRNRHTEEFCHPSERGQLPARRVGRAMVCRRWDQEGSWAGKLTEGVVVAELVEVVAVEPPVGSELVVAAQVELAVGRWAAVLVAVELTVAGSAHFPRSTSGMTGFERATQRPLHQPHGWPSRRSCCRLITNLFGAEIVIREKTLAEYSCPQ